jgi:AbrB family looped-hinge helix DNA binding protein
MVMPMEMEVKVDKQGRIVLPKEIRDKYHLEPNSELTLIEQPEGVFLKPKPAKRKLKDIFKTAPQSDMKAALLVDVANYHEGDIDEQNG